MKSSCALILTSCFFGFTVQFSEAQSPIPGKKTGAVAGRLLFKPIAGVQETDIHAMLSVQGAAELDEIPGIGVRVIKVPAAALEKVMAALKKDKRVKFVEPDFIAQASLAANDEFFTAGYQWSLGTIQAPAAWDYTTGASSIIVAVLDTGVDYQHPDLQGKLLGGYDFVNSDSNPSDDNGHGTGVSGLIASSTNNSTGMAAVAWGTPVLPVKVLDAAGSGSHSAIAKGINYAADQGARVINLSLGGTSSSSTLQSAVDYAWNKGAVIIAAAGNNGNSTPVYPAACANVVAVSATNSADLRPSWSNYGTYVDVAAPGENILSTYRGTYYYLSGTSFSSPITSGVAALMVSVSPGLTNTQVVDLLQKNSDDIGATGYDPEYGHGRINAYRAVTAAAGTVAIDTTVPQPVIYAPLAGATVSGTVTVNAGATDNVAVVKMELYIDGTLVATNSASSISYSWNSLNSAEGSHTVLTRAYDAASNVGSSSVQVNVKNLTVADATAPTVSVTSPGDGTTVSGTVKINVQGSDNVGVTRMELFLDGKLFGTTTLSTATFSWNTRRASKGEHQLQSYAYDAAGNIGGSSVVRVYR